MSRNVITSSTKSKTVGGGLNTVPYNDRNLLAILYFKSQTQSNTVYTKEITRERSKILSLGLALRLYPLLYPRSFTGLRIQGIVLWFYTGQEKRPTIRNFEIKLSIPPELVLCNT